MKKSLIKLKKNSWFLCVALLIMVCLIGGKSFAKYMSEIEVGRFNLSIITVDQAYAVYSADDQSLEFFYGNKPILGGKSPNNKTVTAVYSGIEATNYSPGWSSYASTIQTVNFIGGSDEDGTTRKIQPRTMRSWFSGFEIVTSFDFTNLDTSNVTSMESLFFACHELVNLNVSSFNTSNTKNMKEMFAGCRKLTSINVSNFNTSNVTTMQNMFSACYALKSLDLSNFNTENVTNMSFMFSTDPAVGESKLENVNLSSFNTEKVTTMSHMFNNCGKLTTLNLSSFNTNSVADMQYMFAGCSSLKSIFAHPDKWILKDNLVAPGMFNSCAVLEGGNSTTWADMHSLYGETACAYKTYAKIDGINGQRGYFTVVVNDPPVPVPYANVTVSVEDRIDYDISFNNVKQHDYFLNESNTVKLTTSGTLYTGSVDLIGTITVGENITNVTAVSMVDRSGKLIIPESFFETENSSAIINIVIKFGKGQKAFAIYSETNSETVSEKNLDFYYDVVPEVGDTYDNKVVMAVYEDIETTEYTCTVGGTASNPTVSSSSKRPAWYAKAKDITSVTFHAQISPISTAGWFAGFVNCDSFTGLEHLTTTKATTMAGMFFKCEKIVDSDLSNLVIDTASARNLSHMFRECKILNNNSGNTFNFINSTGDRYLTDLRGMFRACGNLLQLDLSNLYFAENDLYFADMFRVCEKIQTITFPQERAVLSFTHYGKNAKINYGTSNMFMNCFDLKNVDISFIKGISPHLEGMFSNCYDITTIYVDVAFTASVNENDLVSMFATCSSLTGGNGMTIARAKLVQPDVDNLKPSENSGHALIDGHNGYAGYFTAKDANQVIYSNVEVELADNANFSWKFDTANQQYFYANAKSVAVNVLELTPKAGVELPDSVSVIIDGTDMSASVTYKKENSTLTIPAKLLTMTSNITIGAGN